MPDPVYVDSIKVSAGSFMVKTSSYKQRTIVRHRLSDTKANEWHMALADLELLYRAIGEYLHMRSMEDA